MHHSDPIKSAAYRPDIDGLRAIAIIAVVFYHAGFAGFPGGFVGVDVFFVISGYLITTQLFNEAHATGSVNLRAFYARRVRRLMPAALVVLATTLLLGAIFMPPGSDMQRSLARSALTVAYFGSNFFFFNNTEGYFDDPTFSMPLLHTWSLAIEEQYYLIWPLLMLLLFNVSKSVPAERNMRQRVLWVLGAMLAGSLLLCIGMTPDHPNFSFYLLPTRVWEFALGGMIGIAGSNGYAQLKKSGELLAGAGIALILYSVATLSHNTPFPGRAAILPVAGAAMLIVGMTANPLGWVRSALSARPVVAIGILSYSWYLWHWPLLSIYRIVNLGDQHILGNAVAVILALALAWLTFVLIERPIRMYRRWGFGSVKSTLLIGLGMSLATALFAVSLLGWYKYQKTAEAYRPYVFARADKSPYRKKCSVAQHLPVDLLTRAECVHGPNKNRPDILLWGDSHADHLMPMLIEGLPENTVSQVTMQGCVPIISYEAQAPSTPKSCAGFNQRMLKDIATLQQQGLKGVVISARWPIYLWKQSISRSDSIDSPPPDAHKLAQARAAMQAGFAATLETLQRTGVKVVVVAPTPELVYPAPDCLALREESHCNVPRRLADEYLKDTTQALAEVTARYPNARFVELMDFFCDSETCHARRNGEILYYDDDHLTATAARALGQHLKQQLGWFNE